MSGSKAGPECIPRQEAWIRSVPVRRWVPQHIDRAGVAAPGQHDETAVTDVGHDGLVVPDPGVRLPAGVRERVTPRRPARTP